MERNVADEAEKRIARALLPATVRRDPELAETVRQFLRAQYGSCRDDFEKEAVEVAIRMVNTAEANRTTNLDPPLGASLPRE